MLLRATILIFSLLGIVSTMMPWVYYPKVDDALYGYYGDGFVTGILFLLVFIIGLLLIIKKRLHIVLWVIAFLAAMLNSVIFYYKVVDFDEEKASHVVDNPIIAAASAGYQLGTGIYVLGFASIFLTITLIVAFMNRAQESESKNNSKLPMLLLFLIGICSFFLIVKPSINFFSKINMNEIKPVLASEIKAMGAALINEDYSTFANYNHPTMVENFGGRKNLFDLLKANAESFKESNTTIEKIELADILKIVEDKKSIQVLLTQKVLFNRNGMLKEDIQKMIAVSENQGKKWYFININNKTKEDLLKIFPFLNIELEF